MIILGKSYDMLLSKNSQSDKSIEIKERISTNCVLLTLVQSEQSLSIKNDQKQDVLPTKDMEKHSSGQNKNERGGSMSVYFAQHLLNMKTGCNSLIVI